MRVMLVDDEEWCLEELAEMIGKIKNVEVRGTYNNAANALKEAARDAPVVQNKQGLIIYGKNNNC